VAYEIRAMSFAEILDTGFRLVRDHFLLLVGCGIWLYVPLALVTAWVSGSIESAAQSPEEVLTALATSLALVLPLALLSPIVTAAITHAIGEVYLGREATVAGSMRFAFGILAPLLGTILLWTLAIAVGLVLFVFPGVYLMMAFLVVNQVMVIERRFGLRALQRSRELMIGHMLRGLGVLLVSGLLVGVLQGGLELVLTPLPWIQPLGSALGQAVGISFSSAVTVLLYFDIRCRNEAFDLEHLSQLVEQEGARRPPPIA
jgi:hypothetical protein